MTFRTITKADVGCFVFEAFGRKWYPQSFIGRVLPIDIGKRVYLVGDILQVENNQQRDARQARESAA